MNRSAPAREAPRPRWGSAHSSRTWSWTRSSSSQPSRRIRPRVYARAEYGSTPAQTQTVFDGLGRATTVELLVYGVKKQTTTTGYTGDSTAKAAVQGGTATRTITDALGRTTEVRTYGGTTTDDPAYGGTAPGTPYTRVSHTYTKDGKEAALTGPDGAKWTYTYVFGRNVTTTSAR